MKFLHPTHNHQHKKLCNLQCVDFYSFSNNLQDALGKSSVIQFPIRATTKRPQGQVSLSSRGWRIFLAIIFTTICDSSHVLKINQYILFLACVDLCILRISNSVTAVT